MLKRNFKTFSLLTILLILFSTPAQAVNWNNPLEKFYAEPLTKKDKYSIVAFNVIQTIDMLQTFEIVDNPAYYETNPILGKHPSKEQVLGYFVLRGIGHYHVTKIIPEKYRGVWHTFSIVANLDTIQNNHSIGIRIGF